MANFKRRVKDFFTETEEEKQRKRLAQAKSYIELCKKRFLIEIEDLLKEIKSLEKTQIKDSETLSSLRSQIRGTKKELERLKNSEKSFSLKVAEEFERIAKISAVARVGALDDGTLEIFTKEITVKKGKENLPLGKFYIRIDLGGRIRIEKFGAGFDFDHPLIRKGMPILGEEMLLLTQLIADYRLSEVAKILIQLIKSQELKPEPEEKKEKKSEKPILARGLVR